MEFNATTITLAILVIGQIVGLVVAIRKPNEKQDVSLGKLETRLDIFGKDMILMKENHLPHIENEMKCLGEKVARIEVILDERLPHIK